MAKKALGKGLGALIKAPTPQVASSAGEESGAGGERVREVALGEIVPSPFQPRKRFEEDQLENLIESIREKGVIQPLIVREVDGKPELIAGERRWRACRALELEQVPVIFREASDQEVLEMALIENLQREDLNPIEEADAYARLAREFSLTQEDISQRVGKSRATVANAIRLLDLDESVQSLVAQGRLSSGHAKAILGLKGHEEQRLAADIVLRRKLNVRATEKLVADQIAGRTSGKASGRGAKPLDPHMQDLQDRLKQRLSTRVAVHHGKKKGRIEIEYYGNDDLDRLLRLLGVPLD